MCLAVRIVVVAPDRQRRLALRRAAVSAEWEVVGEAEHLAAGIETAGSLRARFVVVDETAASGPIDMDEVAASTPRMFLVGVGDVAASDAQVPVDGLARLRGVMAELLHAAGDHTH